MNKYKNIAVELVNIIGRENIISATHCATRLRLQVKDRGLIDDEKIRNVDEVKGVFFNSGQYQVILGTGIVNKVYSEFMQAFNISEVSKDEMSRQGSSSLQAESAISRMCLCRSCQCWVQRACSLG